MTQKMLYKKEIKRITKRIAKKYNPEKIILYGSCATGKISSDSDIDMFIVKRTALPRSKRASKVYRTLRGLNYRVAFEPIVYTPGEVKERLELGDFFVKNIYEHGKVLYERPS